MVEKDGMKIKVVTRVWKFIDPNNEIANKSRNGVPVEKLAEIHKAQFKGVEENVGNVGLDTGITELLQIITGNGSPTKWDAAHAKLGCGDSATAADHTQTGLQAATNYTSVAMDGTYPTVSNQTMTFQSTYGAGVGTWHWQEYVVTNSDPKTGKCIDRVVNDKGTKGASDSWILQLALTVS
jgi:hypothetical protein